MTKLTYTSKTINAGSNAKTVKGDDEYLTAIMYLAPYDLSRNNTCPMALLAGCHKGCLNTAGRGKFNSIQESRIKKTNWYWDRKDHFMETLAADILRFKNKCEKNGVHEC